jgi:tetratricopeptide (TPR) repeat protein
VTTSTNASPQETDLLVDIFEAFLSNTDVGREIGQLLRGHTLEMNKLAQLFVASGYDAATLPNLEFQQGMQAFEVAFVEAASDEPTLQGVIQTNQLLAQTRIQRDLSETVRSLLEFLRTANPATVEIRAGKVTATAIDTGRQVQYQWERYVDRRITAQTLEREARDRMEQADWDGAEELLQKALDLHSNLPGARSHFALTLSEDVLARFRREHTVRNMAVDLQRTLEDERRGIRPPSPISPTIEAAVWLLEALRHDDNPDGRVLANLALVYGVTRRTYKMLKCVREALAATPSLREYLLVPHQLIALAHGCGNDRESLRALGVALSVTLPASNEQVQQSIEAIDLEDPQTRAYGIVWSVMGQPTIWVQGPSPSFPAPLRIFAYEQSAEESAQLRTQACYNISVVNEPIQSRCIPEGPGETLSPRELVRELAKRFLFVCPLS